MKIWKCSKPIKSYQQTHTANDYLNLKSTPSIILYGLVGG